MKHSCLSPGAALVQASLLCLLASACLATAPAQRRAGVLDFLYPAGSAAQPPQSVSLQPPVRVGLAFVPETESGMAGPLDATQKQRLLERIAAAFREEQGVGKIEIIPTSYLVAGGGFANVDQLRGLFGIDLIALVSYDQRQVEDLGTSSWTYWTIVGAYVVKGNQNDTHTFVDTSVFDIASRALLFNAGGQSQLESSATAIEAPQEMRAQSIEGFEKSVEDMIVELRAALAAFREQAKTGTVRGAGTPELSVTPADGASGPGGTGGTGAGAAGALELGCGLLLVLAGLARRRASSGGGDVVGG